MIHSEHKLPRRGADSHQAVLGHDGERPLNGALIAATGGQERCAHCSQPDSTSRRDEIPDYRPPQLYSKAALAQITTSPPRFFPTRRCRRRNRELTEPRDDQFGLVDALLVGAPIRSSPELSLLPCCPPCTSAISVTPLLPRGPPGPAVLRSASPGPWELDPPLSRSSIRPAGRCPLSVG